MTTQLGGSSTPDFIISAGIPHLTTQQGREFNSLPAGERIMTTQLGGSSTPDFIMSEGIPRLTTQQGREFNSLPAGHT
ncbi:MAG: hypothetical protein HYR77_00590 [Ignavibacteria bacterium]|nr:hypothetical protein [Ignavibacteria bacterium]